MPARTPPVPNVAAEHLAQLGARLRAYRKDLKVSAVAAAEAAGMSRVTWHRIERGEPSVAMGAYLSAALALGLTLDLVDSHPPASAAAPALADLPERLRIDDYPQLRRLAWQLDPTTEITPREALSMYQRNWRHVDSAALSPAERELLRRLQAAFGEGAPLV